MSNEYFILHNDKEAGPYSQAQLRSMWLAGSLTGDVLFAQPGATEWLPLSNLREQLEGPETIKAEKIAQAAKPDSQAEMLVFVALSFLLPIVGLIMGPVYMRQPGPKRAQGGTLLGVAIAGIVIWLILFMMGSASASSQRQAEQIRRAGERRAEEIRQLGQQAVDAINRSH